MRRDERLAALVADVTVTEAARELVAGVCKTTVPGDRKAALVEAQWALDRFRDRAYREIGGIVCKEGEERGQ